MAVAEINFGNTDVLQIWMACVAAPASACEDEACHVVPQPRFLEREARDL